MRMKQGSARGPRGTTWHVVDQHGHRAGGILGESSPFLLKNVRDHNFRALGDKAARG